MKVLFFDSLMPKGHKPINNKYIGILCKMGIELYVCEPESWFNSSEDIRIVEGDWSVPQSEEVGKAKYRKRIVQNIRKLRKTIENLNPDIIYFASYDIIATFFAIPYLYKYRSKIILQEHNNVDQLINNRIKFVIYNTYKNLFSHFVLEPYIKEKLIDIGVRDQLVCVVPHPITGEYYEGHDNEKLVVGLSNSNDETTVNQMIEAQEKTHCFDSTECKFVIKSKSLSYKDEHLEIFNGWISAEDYQYFSHKCEFFIIPFSMSNFSYRVSNVFMEAVSNSKRIIVSRTPLTEYYSNKYPHICEIFDDISQIPKIVRNTNEHEYIESRKVFINDHSDDTIAKAFNDAFEIKVKQ